MDGSPGWDAITDALRPLYGDASPLHLAATPPWALGGRDPLDGISAYPRTDPVPTVLRDQYGAGTGEVVG